jgi:coatomer subunit beta
MATMDVETERYCTCLIFYDKGVPPTSDELAKRLEQSSATAKIEALEELVLLMVNGESYPNLLMTVIRFCVTSNDHRVKKLLMMFWECVDKHKGNGELREEMILVCNALRNDLMHANEYVRGCTLRLLCKMKYYRVIEPLKEAIIRNLSHRHSYVRRNAVMCIYALVKHFGLEVMPEAVNNIEELLLVEGDLATKRNALLMLLHCDAERATKYVFSLQDQVPNMGDILQLCVLELVRKVCRTSPAHKGRLLRIIFNLTSSSSMAVSYDCASSLVTLSSLPMAIVQATQAYVSLLTEQSDNNVKLIVLDRLKEVQKHHRQVMETMVMDILRALSCPSLDVRKKVMDICLGSLVSPRNIKDVVALLKKEIIKTLGHEAAGVEGNMEYRRLLIRAIHACTGQAPDQAESVMFLLMDFLTETDQMSATEVVMFLRELIANHTDIRAPILEKLAEILGDVHQSQVLRVCLWLFGEYCEEADQINNVISKIIGNLKPLPLIAEDPSAKDSKKEAGEKSGEKKAPAAAKFTTRTVVLKDGTYGTENVYEGGAADAAEAVSDKKDAKKTQLRTLLLGGDFLLSSMLSVSLTKLCLKTSSLSSELRNEVFFVLANLYKIVRVHACGGEQSGSAVRIAQCVRTLAADGGKALADNQKAAAELMKGEWTSGHGREQLANVLELATQNSEWTLGSGAEEVEEKLVAPDESIVFRQLLQRKVGMGAGAEIIDDDDDFKSALRTAGSSAADGSLFSKRLAKVQQMTGLADPVYVEAFLQVHSFDLVLELLMVNRTSEVLNNVLVELSTQGDLKLVDRPVGVTLEPGQQMMVHASIKVGSTETGIIFGYVTYEKKQPEKTAADKRETSSSRMMDSMDGPPPDTPSKSNRMSQMVGLVKRFKQIAGANSDAAFEAVWEEVLQESIVLNELHVDILDYIERAWIGELAFRTMWSEFEWENKININTSITEVGAFLEHIMLNTKMSVVGRSHKTLANLKGKKKEKVTAEDVKEMLREAVGVQKLIESSSFVAVNLYAKSIFGEDALANISIEKLPDGKLTGSVRIRSRTQGIALSLGDRITIVQRGVTGKQTQKPSP